jgi:hypothetical protein
MYPNAQHLVMARKAASMVAVMVCFVVTRLRQIRRDESVPYGPRTHAERHRQSTLQMMFNYNDIECIAMLRMRRVPFFSLCNLLRSRGLVPETVGCPVEEQVAMFLHVVGHNQRFRVVHQSFRRSIETVSRIFHQVLYAIGELRGRKNSPTQNVMAAVSFDLKFTYVLAGWEGSAHDALILADVIQRNDGFTTHYTISYYLSPNCR